MWKRRLNDIAICYFIYSDLGKIYIIVNLISIITFIIGLAIEEKTFFQFLVILLFSGFNVGIICINIKFLLFLITTK